MPGIQPGEVVVFDAARLTTQVVDFAAILVGHEMARLDQVITRYQSTLDAISKSVKEKTWGNFTASGPFTPAQKKELLQSYAVQSITLIVDYSLVQDIYNNSAPNIQQSLLPALDAKKEELRSTKKTLSDLEVATSCPVSLPVDWPAGL